MIEDKYRLTTVLGWLTLTAHAATHLLVSLVILHWLGISDPFFFAAIIGLSHFLIDYGKISGVYGVLADQVLHWSVIAAIVLCISLS